MTVFVETQAQVGATWICEEAGIGVRPDGAWGRVGDKRAQDSGVYRES